MVKNECESKQSIVLTLSAHKELTLSKCIENLVQTRVLRIDIRYGGHKYRTKSV